MTKLADTETRKFWAQNNVSGKKGFQSTGPKAETGGSTAGAPAPARSYTYDVKAAYDKGQPINVDEARAAGVQVGDQVSFRHVQLSGPFIRGEGQYHDDGIVTKISSRSMTVRHPSDPDRTTTLSAKGTLLKGYGKGPRPPSYLRPKAPSTLPEIDRATLGSKRAERMWRSRGGPPPLYD